MSNQSAALHIIQFKVVTLAAPFFLYSKIGPTGTSTNWVHIRRHLLCNVFILVAVLTLAFLAIFRVAC